MKNLIALFSLLLLVSCQNNSTPAHSKFKTILLRSEGEVETLPNQASFYIRLECLDFSIKKSKQCLIDKSNELNDKLLALGVDQDDILTTAVDLDKSYRWQNSSQIFEGYKSSTRIYLTVKDIDKLDEIYTELLENRNLDLGGLSYSHSEIDSLKNEAYLNALKKAGELSDKLLEQIPETKKEILKIGNVEISASQPDANQFLKQEADNFANSVAKFKSIAISKGTVKVTASLYVEYQIK
ncbi:SIMPL domain-containing protein [Croceimicrobium hydrocarbonivorans]|uniref:SIMPL domain-containing protein n=1 Tax=Croceimicrobium hydrocarbonivorans TaxID=2761580 RepID=A0A7H0VC25_9FLAO|nr:SIMPL domain-containing protein [Croceimicrobium hydrocarbonivorans]QNR23273.1 SIMPL domain-containing protein [Croceimicrobium hydrocarbonivorans]